MTLAGKQAALTLMLTLVVSIALASAPPASAYELRTHRQDGS